DRTSDRWPSKISRRSCLKMSNPLEAQRKDNVLVLRLNRPQVRNALNLELVQALAEILDQAASDADVTTVLLGTTDSTAFSAGMDTNDSQLAGPTATSAALTALTWTLASYPKPVIAAVPGYVIGGGAELALTADIRIGDATTKFRFPGTGYGLVQGSWHLVDAIGPSWAKQLVLTGRLVDANESQRLGLIHELSDNAEDRGLAVAQELTHRSPIAMAESKRLIREASGRPLKSRFDDEALVTEQLMQDHDVIARLRARNTPG
ncbi:MAG: enoyl-CoA hydratase/isomerase family protein, partial [Solirubrobacteraceae bacterium]